MIRASASIFVSKRLQRAASALLCLMAVQLLLAVASCEPEFVGSTARVAIPLR